MGVSLKRATIVGRNAQGPVEEMGPRYMTDDGPSRQVACTLTDAQEAQRSEAVQQTLAAHYRSANERPDGYTVRFNGTDAVLPAVASFVASELHCCSFADYAIDVSPPYEETHLTITGPAGTKDVFAELLTRLETHPSPDASGSV